MRGCSMSTGTPRALSLHAVQESNLQLFARLHDLACGECTCALTAVLHGQLRRAAA